MPLSMEEKRLDLVGVDEQGFILFNGDRFSQRDAAILAWHLIDAVDRSINRNQIGTRNWNSTQEIIRRMESNIGQAKAAIGKLF